MDFKDDRLSGSFRLDSLLILLLTSLLIPGGNIPGFEISQAKVC